MIIEPARRMEDDLLQVATDMESKGDLNQAISTLEALYERRYCYKKCLSKLGVMENRRGGYPAALIFCREVRFKCRKLIGYFFFTFLTISIYLVSQYGQI